jgi:hypothetical protein
VIESLEFKVEWTIGKFDEKVHASVMAFVIGLESTVFALPVIDEPVILPRLEEPQKLAFEPALDLPLCIEKGAHASKRVITDEMVIDLVEQFRMNHGIAPKTPYDKSA